MSAHPHLAHHGHFVNARKQWPIELVITLLAGTGLFCFISKWIHGEFFEGLVDLGMLAGPATVYAFGYLWCLPDLLSDVSSDASRTLRQRWSDFSLLSTFIALLVIIASYAWAIVMNYSSVSLPLAVTVVLAVCWALAACMAASEKYLGWSLPAAEARSPSGWRSHVRSAVRKWGVWLVKLVGVKRALGIGGVLTLVSLELAVGASWFSSNKGYSVLLGKEGWPTPVSMDIPAIDRTVAFALRGIYALGLLAAAIALMSLISGRLGNAIRRSRTLAFVCGMIVLLQLALVACGFTESHYRLVPAMLLWIVPAILWLRGAAIGRRDWDHVRLALMVFYLPIFLVGFAFLVVFTYFSIGFGSFVFGMLLLWWGLIQSRHEMNTLNTRRRV